MKTLRWRTETAVIEGKPIPYRWSTDGSRLWVHCSDTSDITRAAGSEHSNRALARLVAEGILCQLV